MGAFQALDPVRDKETGEITIRVPKPKVAAMLSQAYDKIEGERGYPVSPDETIWLYELAKECLLPKADSPPSFLVPPVVLGAGTTGELTLHELCVAAIAWCDNCATKWWDDDYSLIPALYAHAHSSPALAGVFSDSELLNRSTAVKKVNAWFKGIRHPHSHLAWACGVLSGRQEHYEDIDLPPNAISRDEDNPTDWGEVVATLSVYYGIKPQEVITMGERVIVGMWKARLNSPALAAMGSANHMDDDGGTKAFLAFESVVKMLCKKKGG